MRHGCSFFFRSQKSNSFLNTFSTGAIDTFAQCCKSNVASSNVVFNRLCDLVSEIKISTVGKPSLIDRVLTLVYTVNGALDPQLEQMLLLNFEAIKLKIKVFF